MFIKVLHIRINYKILTFNYKIIRAIVIHFALNLLEICNSYFIIKIFEYYKLNKLTLYDRI
jgi:hypothetical protein